MSDQMGRRCHALLLFPRGPKNVPHSSVNHGHALSFLLSRLDSFIKGVKGLNIPSDLDEARHLLALIAFVFPFFILHPVDLPGMSPDPARIHPSHV